MNDGLQVLDPATETVKGEWTFGPDGPGTITHVTLVAALGSETDLILRPYRQRAGLNSVDMRPPSPTPSSATFKLTGD